MKGRPRTFFPAPRRCPECGKEYTPRVRQQLYCSRLCRNAAAGRAHRRTRAELEAAKTAPKLAVLARLAALDERHAALGIPVTRHAGARGNIIENRGRIPGGTGAQIWRPE